MSASPRWALVLCCVPAFMVALDNLVLITALPTIRRDLHSSIGALSWTVNAYVLSLGVLMLAGAMLGDRLGRRRMFATGLLLFTFGSAAAALAPTAGWLVVARAVQGCGAALVMPLSLALACGSLPPGQRGVAVGVWGGVTGAAVALGPLVGGAIVEGLDWQWIFWLNVPVGLTAAALSTRLLPETYGDRRPIDTVGLVLASGGLLGVVWGVVRGGQVGWTAAQTLLPLLAGVGLLAGFVAWQRRTETPLLARHLLAGRDAAAANASSFFMAAALFAAAFLVPQYLQTALGHGPLEAGVRLLPWTAVSLLVTPLAGVLADRIGNRPLLVGGLVLQATGFAWLAAIASPTLAYLSMLPALLVAGVGIALVFPAAANAVVGGVRDEDVNLASATNSSFREIGGAFGVAISVTVFAGSGSLATPTLFTNGIVPALAVASGLSLAGALIGLRLRPARVAAQPAFAESI